MWIFSVLVRCLVQNKHLALHPGILPYIMLFSPGQPSSHHLLTSSIPPLTRASCMPQSFFIGKKREMYEHPVFCLASQVMDLTIREYLHSPLPSVALLLLLLSTSIPFPASLLNPEMLLPPCLFVSCGFCLEAWVRSVQAEISAVPHRISRGSIVRTICLWWTWMSSLVCKLLSFGWMPIPLTWMHFYIAYIVVSSSHLVWSYFSSVMCQTGRGLFFFFTMATATMR